MILKHVFIQLINKKKQIILLATILLISYFAVVLIFNILYVYLVKSFSPIIDIQIKQRTELLLEWKSQEQPNSIADMRDRLKEKLLETDYILAADYVLTDLLPGRTRSLANSYYQENMYFIYCGADFYKVFDIELEKGRWLKTKEYPDAVPEVVITKQHAENIGIKEINTHSELRAIRYSQSAIDTINYQVVGISEDLENMRDENKLSRNTFPVFMASSAIDSRFRNLRDHLTMNVKEGTSPKLVTKGIEQILRKLNIDMQVYRYQNSTLKQKRKIQVAEHFARNKILYGTLIITLIYIMLVMFGNFWKLSNNRFTEIGIRKAVGHSRGNVIRYLLYENLMIYTIVMFVAAFIIASLYSNIFSGFNKSIFFICGGLFLIVIVIASLIPVFRAGSVNPVTALSDE